VRSLRIPNYAVLVGIIVSLILLVWIPYNVIQAVSNKTFDTLFGAIIVLVSMGAGGILAFFSIVFGFAEPFVSTGDVDRKRRELREMEEKMRIYRARQRAMLEELDEIKRLLEEIRDLLKEGMAV
jgi:cell shape-determining protein MreC